MLNLSSRPTTNPGPGRQSSMSQWRPLTQMRRCRTTLDRHSLLGQPKRRYCESCTVEYIRRLQVSNMETEEKLKNSMHVQGIQRSKSDLDMNIEGLGRQAQGSGLLRERSQVYLTNVPDLGRRESQPPQRKQEVKVAKAVVPRKGLIQLSSIATPQPFTPEVEAKKKPETAPPSTGKTGNLIRRKDILDQIRLGNKLLEESEQQKHEEEEMTKSLGDYTILDLQSRILEMTDVKNIKKTSFSGTAQDVDGGEKKDSKSKGVTLPSINKLKIF